MRGVGVQTLGNEDSLVNTLGYAAHRVDELGRITNAGGDVSWICHQYDRLAPDLLRRIRTPYELS